VSYAELAAATNFSFLRGASHPDEMVLQAKALGLAAIGIADRNTLAGVVRAHRAAKEAGIRLLVGARIVTRCGFEAIAYPVDRAAYGRLCRLLTLGSRRAPKGECHIDVADLVEHAAGLALIVLGGVGAPEATLAVLKRQLPDPTLLFLGVARRFAGDDLAEMIAARALARRLGLACLAVQDALYHVPQRRPLADVVTCIRTHVTIDAAGRALAANAERHLKPAAEMARLFSGFEEAIAAQAEVLARVRFSLDELRYEYPDEVVHPGETAMQSLERLTWAGAARRYPNGVPAAVAAVVRHEFDLIAQLDYAKYFLTVREIVAFADSAGHPGAGARLGGQFGGVLLPWDHRGRSRAVDLLFERFVSPERKEPPDIDVDFEHERREEVIQHIYETYGRERAGLAATVITYRGKSAIREVGKALGLSADTIEALSRTTVGLVDRRAERRSCARRIGARPDNPRLRLALDLTQQLVGFPRHLSQHVGGFVITRGPLEELVPIGNAAMADRTFIEWDKDDIDALGILKIDILALGMLTCRGPRLRDDRNPLWPPAVPGQRAGRRPGRV
jgi:error-prone DNA polymerase